MMKVQSEPRPILIHAALALLVIACLVARSGQALAEADGPDYYRVVNVAQNDVLNIRSQPTAKAPKIGEIPAGADCVRNLGCRGGLTLHEFSTLSEAQKAERLRQNPRWCQVEYRGISGWVAGRYLAEGSCSD
jgi:uncharacterized protein YraI